MTTEQNSPAAISIEKWNELSAQLVELQTQLAFQEDALQSLDDVVASQQRSLDQLLQFQQRLEQRIAELSDDGDQPPADQRPPHY